MSGNYFHPIKNIFLNLSGGTVTGDTVFSESLSTDILSANTIYSGSNKLEDVILSLSEDVVTQQRKLSIDGGVGGPYLFTGQTQLENLSPSADSEFDIGSTTRRFRNLNIVDGVSVNFTASTRIKTQQIELGDKIITDLNIILTGQSIDGGNW